MPDLVLQNVTPNTEVVLSAICSDLHIPRTLLPSRQEIDQVWTQLPNLLTKIEQDLRDEKIAKMCVAVGTGLFDSAVNYVWNQSVIELRKRIIAFGLDVVKQIKSKEYTVRDIDALQDSDLLTLLLQLDIIDDEAYYFLSQCRDIRNNFSAAHPAMGNIDSYELLTYINRCVKYSLSRPRQIVGVDVRTMLSIIKNDQLDDQQVEAWKQKVATTHQAQKESIFSMFHGIYCDPAKQQIERANVLSLSIKCRPDFNSGIISSIIDQHEEYVATSDERKRAASEDFLIKIGLFDALKDAARHAVLSRLCKQMLQIHQSTNNFHNEAPFAEYLWAVSQQAPIPDTIKNQFVETVVSCAVGNEWGYAWAAAPYYDRMITNFSPKEIEIMLNIPNIDSYAKYKITTFPKCIVKYKEKVRLLNQTLIPASLLSLYKQRTS